MPGRNDGLSQKTLYRWGGTVRPISDKEFSLFQALIHREAGIFLSEAKRALLVSRLQKRLKQLGIKTYEAYYRRVTEDDDERARLLDSISTNETHFFREPRHWEFIEKKIFPEWKTLIASGQRGNRIRAWSAACSSGEEPYSLAMMLCEHFPPSMGYRLEILGTDLSTQVLNRARAALYSIEKAKEIPEAFLRTYMLKGTRSQRGKMKAGPEIRSVVRIDRVNLNDESYPVSGLFDLIFCRNVLIYFKADSKIRVIHRLLNHLAPGGYLFLGHAESLGGVTNRVRSVIPTVYVHAE